MIQKLRKSLILFLLPCLILDPIWGGVSISPTYPPTHAAKTQVFERDALIVPVLAMLHPMVSHHAISLWQLLKTSVDGHSILTGGAALAVGGILAMAHAPQGPADKAAILAQFGEKLRGIIRD